MGFKIMFRNCLTYKFNKLFEILIIVDKIYIQF